MLPSNLLRLVTDGCGCAESEHSMLPCCVLVHALMLLTPVSLISPDACRSVQPLLGLVQLQQLELWLGRGRPDITADQLRQLSRLTTLMRLQYKAVAEPSSAAAWPLLPLRRLELSRASRIIARRV